MAPLAGGAIHSAGRVVMLRSAANEPDPPSPCCIDPEHLARIRSIVAGRDLVVAAERE